MSLFSTQITGTYTVNVENKHEKICDCGVNFISNFHERFDSVSSCVYIGEKCGFLKNYTHTERRIL